jgi:Meckel syndrome type 1 protein
VSPQAAAAARVRAAAAPARAPLRRPIAPRRVSGPVVRRQPVAAPAHSALVRILDAPFLGRLLRGRVWIALVAAALLGIVAMQVAILRLGAGIGASVTRIQQLEQANQSATTAIAGLEPGGGVASKAAKLGMVYPPAGDVGYLHFRPGLAAKAAESITRPTAPLVSASQSAALTAPVNTSTQAATPASVQTSTTPPQTGVSDTSGVAAPAAPASSAAVGPAGGSAAPPSTAGG